KMRNEPNVGLGDRRPPQELPAGFYQTNPFFLCALRAFVVHPRKLRNEPISSRSHRWHRFAQIWIPESNRIFTKRTHSHLCELRVFVVHHTLPQDAATAILPNEP